MNELLLPALVITVWGLWSWLLGYAYDKKLSKKKGGVYIVQLRAF